MRLLFERDLTPHPQYAAFYLWLQNEFKADAVLHYGMHGTVEWLPGAPLGNFIYFDPLIHIHIHNHTALDKVSWIWSVWIWSGDAMNCSQSFLMSNLNGKYQPCWGASYQCTFKRFTKIRYSRSADDQVCRLDVISLSPNPAWVSVVLDKKVLNLSWKAWTDNHLLQANCFHENVSDCHLMTICWKTVVVVHNVEILVRLLDTSPVISWCYLKISLSFLNLNCRISFRQLRTIMARCTTRKSAQHLHLRLQQSLWVHHCKAARIRLHCISQCAPLRQVQVFPSSHCPQGSLEDI